jgi:cytochrome P450
MPDLGNAPEDILDLLLTGEPLARQDPYALYAELRERSRVFRSERHGIWALSGYAEVLTALRHGGASMATALAGNEHFETSSTLKMMADSMLFVDDVERHRRQRRLVRSYFTRQGVESLRDYIAGLVDELLAARAEEGTFDFMGGFADHIPVAVVCHLLGVPNEDIETFRDWNYLITASSAAVVSEEQMAKVDEATDSLHAYLVDLLAEHRRSPGEDLISHLMVSQAEGDGLDDEETMSMAFLLLVAGSDTTAAFLGGALLALLRNPDQLRLLRDDRALLPGAIEELMRFEAPVHFGIMRTTTEPLALESVEIPAGERVWTILSAANRDPARFERPDELDLTRDRVAHLGFAQGMHMCLGAMLGRLESTIALEATLRRFPALSLAEDGEIPWINHGNLRGIARLDVASG